MSIRILLATDEPKKPTEEELEKERKARAFAAAVIKLHEEHKLSFFFVTEGASATRNAGCDAVRAAREAHEEWERQHGIDTEHDWATPKTDDQPPTP